MADALTIIGRAVRELGPGQLERRYQRAIKVALDAANIDLGRPSVQLGDGYIQVDCFIREPPLLVELKSSGDWKAVACGMAQLYLYGGLEGMTEARRVLVLPEQPQHPQLRDIAERLCIEIFVP